MAYSKTFPKSSDKSIYPKWTEVTLTENEEDEEDKKCKLENIRLMKECINDARKILFDEKLRDYQTNVMTMAVALFEKRASHAIYWKEKRAKEKFDSSKEE